MQYTNQKQEMILFLLERSTAQQDLGKKKSSSQLQLHKYTSHAVLYV